MRALPITLVAFAIACSAPDESPSTSTGVPEAGTPVPRELPAPAAIGGERPARVLVPRGYDAIEPRPALFLLGGYDYLSKDLDEWIKVSALVDELGFVLVMPDGKVDAEGSPYWNATDKCCDYDGTGVDDLGYLVGLRDELRLRFAIDVTRMAVLGHSAGGFMAHRLACDASDGFTAVASLAGSMWLDLSRCKPTKPVSVLQVHGTADEVMPIGGDADAPGAAAVIERWATLDHCTGTGPGVPDAAVRDYVPTLPGEETILLPVLGCPAGVGVELWRIDGADHYPDVTPAFTADVVRWLLAHPRP